MIKSILNALFGARQNNTGINCKNCKNNRRLFINGICQECYNKGLCPICNENECFNSEIICKTCFDNNICPTCFGESEWRRVSHICTPCAQGFKCKMGNEVLSGACPKCVNRFTPNDKSTLVYECNNCVRFNRENSNEKYCYICNYSWGNKHESSLSGYRLYLCKTCWFYDETKTTLGSPVPPPIHPMWNSFDSRRGKIYYEYEEQN